jgi:hypothetical protein
MTKYQAPRFIQASQTYKVTIEGHRLYQNVNVHTLYLDGTYSERVMPLYEALQHQADMMFTAKAVTIWPAV